MTNTTNIGTLTEGMVLAAMLRAGKTVLLPFGDREDYDMVIEDQGKFFRIQCKTGRLKNGSVHFNLYTMAQEAGTKKHVRRTYGEKVDLYGVYCPQTGTTYLVPRDVVAANVGTLRVEPTANCQIKNIRWAKEYEV